VIIKGTSCAGARRLFIHLTRVDTNERVEVRELRGVVAEDLRGALLEMEAVAAGARTTKPFYHASINTLAVERMTDEQRAQAIDRLEAEMGLSGQPRMVVVHDKKDREHCHIVWSRIDLDRMAAISDSHNYRKHEEVARALEREFGFERVQGAHVERDGKERPGRTPSHSEMLQAERTGLSPQQAKELMTATWQTTTSGKEFAAALQERGWILARGDRRDFVAIDPNGGVHSVARRIEGAKAEDVRQRFGDIDPRDLNSVAEAKQVQRERAQRHKETGRDRQGAVAKPREAGQQLQPKTAEQAERGRQGGLERDRARSAAAKPREAGQRSQPKAASQARTASGPRQRTPGVRGAARTAVKIADSVFSALMGEKPSPPKEKESETSQQAKDAATPSPRRQELMRQLSREITQETERDAEIELDRGRERQRGS
jgi:hypothetical protein